MTTQNTNLRKIRSPLWHPKNQGFVCSFVFVAKRKRRWLSTMSQNITKNTEVLNSKKDASRLLAKCQKLNSLKPFRLYDHEKEKPFFLGSNQMASGRGGSFLCDTPLLRVQVVKHHSEANQNQMSKCLYEGGMLLHPSSTPLPQSHSATFMRSPKDIQGPSILSWQTFLYIITKRHALYAVPCQNVRNQVKFQLHAAFSTFSKWYSSSLPKQSDYQGLHVAH